MTKLNFAERIARAFISGSTPDIKGKTRITLTDIRNGSREVFEDENMITNAVANVYNSNYLGVTDYYSMMPIWHMFGGIMCFSQTLPENANSFYPPNNSVAIMTANAGQTAHSTASTTRGNPDGTLTQITNDKITLAWQWGPNQGNGTIACCCLTHQQAGDCGLLPDGTLPLLKSTGRNIDNINCYSAYASNDGTYNRARAIAMPVSLDNDGNGISLYCDGTSLEEIIVAHSWVSAMLLEGNTTLPQESNNYREISTRTATLSRTFSSGYTMIAQDASNYYVMERDSGSSNKLYVDVVSKTDMTVTAKTLSNLGVTLARPSLARPQIYNGIVSNGSVYWLSASDSAKFVRVNINNTADVEELTSNMPSAISQAQSPIVLNDGLILGRNFLVNGSRVYPVTARTGRSGNNNESVTYDIIANYKGGPHMLQTGNQNNTDTYNYDVQAGVLALPYLASINNLNSAVTKQNTKAMLIEYELTEL